MEAIAEVYRYELSSLGIDSVVIEPGAYSTPIIDKLEHGEDSGRKAGYGEMAQVPERIQNRIRGSRANAQDIADAVLQIIETPPGQRQMRYRMGPGGPGSSASMHSLTRYRGRCSMRLGYSSDEIQALVSACQLARKQ
jgi:hypothetical protein